MAERRYIHPKVAAIVRAIILHNYQSKSLYGLQWCNAAIIATAVHAGASNKAKTKAQAKITSKRNAKANVKGNAKANAKTNANANANASGWRSIGAMVVEIWPTEDTSIPRPRWLH